MGTHSSSVSHRRAAARMAEGGRLRSDRAPLEVRRVGRRVVAGLAIGLAIGSLYWLLTAPRFQVKEAVVNAPNFCEVALRSVLPVGQNIFMVRTQPLREALRGDPRIGSVRVIRHWPNRVEIAVTQKAVVGRVWLQGELMEVGTDGQVLPPSASGSGLPLLHGSIQRSDGSIDPGKVRMAKQILDSARSEGIAPVTKMDFVPGGRINLSLDGRLLVKLGRPEDVGEKLLVAASALETYGADRIAYVDVELPERPVVKLR